MTDNEDETAKTPHHFSGMMPIMPTAISETSDIDEQSQRRLVQYCLKCGAVAVGHFGIASEFHKVTDADRSLLIKIIVDEVAGRAPTFMGVTANGVKLAVEYAKQAEELGADLIMAALPYVDMPDDNGAYDYYAQLSDATNLPIIIQDTPASSNILTAPLLWKMFQEIEGVQHVKAEGKNFLDKTAHLIELSNGTMSVIGGSGGEYLIHLLRLGVKAFMTGTEALDLHAATVSSYTNGDTDKAADIYFQQILPYLGFYMTYPEQLLKKMLYDRGVMSCPAPLAPPAGPPMSKIAMEEFDWILDRINWRKQWPDIP